MASPRCGFCESTSITYQTRTFHGKQGILIYCASCGAVLAWTPNP